MRITLALIFNGLLTKVISYLPMYFKYRFYVRKYRKRIKEAVKDLEGLPKLSKESDLTIAYTNRVAKILNQTDTSFKRKLCLDLCLNKEVMK